MCCVEKDGMEEMYASNGMTLQVCLFHREKSLYIEKRFNNDKKREIGEKINKKNNTRNSLQKIHTDCTKEIIKKGKYKNLISQ